MNNQNRPFTTRPRTARISQTTSSATTSPIMGFDVPVSTSRQTPPARGRPNPVEAQPATLTRSAVDNPDRYPRHLFTTATDRPGWRFNAVPARSVCTTLATTEKILLARHDIAIPRRQTKRPRRQAETARVIQRETDCGCRVSLRGTRWK
jgi:hypothetical protein